MTQPESSVPQPSNPSQSRDLFVALVLSLYVELPETPRRANQRDREQAQRLFARGVPPETVEAALLLASLRRLVRPAGAPALGAIQSLAYFQPAVEELLQQPVRRGYLEYLRHKLKSLNLAAKERR